jgi:vWA-MoxR associated protein C-terminal domain/Trypsin-like peptidase domain/vWA-MoxR associated protein middle region (VMAP-M) 1
MEFEDGKKAIARIYSAAGEVAGVGFLVSDRYVLTCAHVVTASVSSPPGSDPIGSPVTLALPFATGDQKYLTQVVFCDLNTAAYGDDFAILRLATVPETVIQSIQLATLPHANPVELRVFGFPKGDEAGRNLTVVSRGSVAGGWEQIEDTKQTGLAIEEGFSGAPVWCQDQKAFVGMVVARDKRRPEAKLGFMIPTQKLSSPSQYIRQHTLLDCLEPEQQTLSEQITIAYQVCCLRDSLKPPQTQLGKRLEELSRMTAGELGEPMLVQFAACLLNQGLSDPIKQQIESWAKRYTANLDGLRVKLQDKQSQKQVVPRFELSQETQQMQPCLLVSVKAHRVKDKHYYVDAWLIRDFNCYDADSNNSQGSKHIVFKHDSEYPEAKDLHPEEGIPEDKIPVLLADYLDQVGDLGIDIQQLTVELLLPLSLMNTPIDQRPIPVRSGLPQSLVKMCHVVVRSQERLEGYRARGRWQTKWRRLQDLLETNAGKVFVSGGENIRQLQRQIVLDDVLGLQLTRKPSTDLRGELAVFLSTGTPIALWVRKENPTVNHWGTCLTHQVFCCMKPGETEGVRCCLESCGEFGLGEPEACCRSLQLAALPQQVAQIRQNAPDFEEDGTLDQFLHQSDELGHHLSFLWEDPRRVPPTITYSNSVL